MGIVVDLCSRLEVIYLRICIQDIYKAISYMQDTGISTDTILNKLNSSLPPNRNYTLILHRGRLCISFKSKRRTPVTDNIIDKYDIKFNSTSDIILYLQRL